MRLRDLSCTFCKKTKHTYRDKTPKAKFFIRRWGADEEVVWKSPNPERSSWLEPSCAGCGRDFTKVSFREGKNEWITQRIMDL